MIFYDHDGKPVEVNFQTFESIRRGGQQGLTPVKLKNDPKEYLLKATEEEILEASVEE